MATRMATTFSADRLSTGRGVARALTEFAVKSLKLGESRSDGALPLGNGRLVVACVKSRGGIRRVWTFRYRQADLRGELMLGEHPSMTLEQARVEARRLLELVRDGQDPKNVRTEARVANVRAAREKASLGSFGALMAAYVAKLRASKKECAREVERLFALHVAKPWPELAKRPANSIDAEELRDVLARLVRLGITRQTNVLRSYLQAAFTHGAHADLDPRRAAADAAVFRLTSNPVTLLPRIQEFESVRDRVLSDAEFRHVWMCLGEVRLEIGLAIRCSILLGGQRFRQLLRATWADYDEASSTLQLSDPKGKRRVAVPHVLPVTAAVASMLAELRQFNGRGTFIFSTSAGAKSIHPTSLPGVFLAIRRAWDGRASAPLADFQGRDLRRSIETRLQALGISREVRAQLLSHGRTSGVQQKHYERHLFLAEKAAALAALEKHLELIMAPAPEHHGLVVSALDVAGVESHRGPSAKRGPSLDATLLSSKSSARLTPVRTRVASATHRAAAHARRRKTVRTSTQE